MDELELKELNKKICELDRVIAVEVYTESNQIKYREPNRFQREIGITQSINNETEKQLEFMRLVNEIITKKSEEKGRDLTACVVTFGCQMNERDSEKLKGILEKCGYVLDFTIEEIRSTYSFTESCQGSVPQAIQAFLESSSFEEYKARLRELERYQAQLTEIATAARDRIRAGLNQSRQEKKRMRGYHQAVSYALQ